MEQNRFLNTLSIHLINIMFEKEKHLEGYICKKNSCKCQSRDNTTV